MADVQLAVTGGAGQVYPGSLIADRAVGLSGWFGSPYDWIYIDNAYRLVDWSKAGVWYNPTTPSEPWLGTKGIPTFPVGIDLTGLSSYGGHTLDPTDTLESGYAILAAIAACSEGHAVLLGPGKYKTALDIPVPGHKVLRGSGPGTTTIHFVHGVNNWTGGVALRGNPNKGSPVNIVSGYTKGSNTIVVADASSFSAGNLIAIDQLDDPSFVVNDTFLQGGCTWCDIPTAFGGGGLSSRALMEIAVIASINGTTITLDHPLHIDRSAGFYPQVTRISTTPAINAGLENITIQGGNDLVQVYGVTFKYCGYCWAKNVEVKSFPKDSFSLNIGVHNEVKRWVARDATSLSGGAGYALRTIMATDCLAEDGIYTDTHSGLIWTTSAGCVLGYNYCYNTHQTDTWMTSAAQDHAYHCYMMLIEGNIGHQFIGDSWYGSGSHHAVLRNHWTLHNHNDPSNPDTTLNYQNLPAIAIGRYHYWYSVIGNVLGCAKLWNPGRLYSHDPQYNIDDSYTVTILNGGYPVIWKLGYETQDYDPLSGYTRDANVAATLLRHGNYDYATLSTAWDPAISSHAIPPSLYLASKPSWFGSLAWPNIGPDVSGLVQNNPAKHRWDNWVGAGKPEDVSLLFADEA